MNTIEEYKTLCEQQRKLIELLMYDQRNRINPPYVVPSMPPVSPSIVPNGPWFNPTFTCRADGSSATVQQMDQGVAK